MKTFLLILFFSLFLNNFSNAEVVYVDSKGILNKEVLKMSAKDQWAYQFVTKTCNKIPTEMLSKSFGGSFEAVSDIYMLKFNKIERFYENHGTSSVIKTVLESQSLYYAFNDCYSGMPQKLKNKMIDRYMLELMVFDFVGNASGLIFGTVGVAKIFKLVIDKVIKYGWGPIKPYIQKTLKWSDKNFRRLEISLGLTVLSAPMAHTFYSDYKQNKADVENEKQQIKEKIQRLYEINKDNSEIKMIVSGLTAKEKDEWQQIISGNLSLIKNICDDLQLYKEDLNREVKARKICESL